MADIAVRAGVSRATVSLVLNEKHAVVGIAEETRQRVLRAASELSYRPNEIARAMVTGRNPVIGFLVRESQREVPTRILAGALSEAESRGYSVKVIRADGPFDHRIIERCAEMRLAGIMVLYINGDSLEYLRQEMARYSTPVAVVDSSFPATQGIRIISDDRDGARQAIEHLASLGHRRIAFISGAPDSGAAAEREEGYRTALASLDIPMPADYLVHGNWFIPRIEEMTHALLEHPAGRPTAIFCADDRTAMIAARTARRAGLRIPEDLSLVGFANLEMAEYGDPPLTTVAQPFPEMGATAVQHLLNWVEEHHRSKQTAAAPVEVVLPTHLIHRTSTAPPPA
jgi:LacI family transcriptional regulator